MGRQTGRVRTEGARSQRDLQGGAASTEEREGESGRSAGGVGAHRHQALSQTREEDEGEGRRRASRPQGEEGERRREAPLGLFPAGL